MLVFIGALIQNVRVHEAYDDELFIPTFIVKSHFFHFEIIRVHVLEHLDPFNYLYLFDNQAHIFMKFSDQSNGYIF